MINIKERLAKLFADLMMLPILNNEDAELRNDKIIIKINKSGCLEIATYQNSGLFIQMRIDHLIGETVLGKAYIKGTSD